jgi:hypothetical protein
MPHGSKLRYGGNGITAEIYNALENDNNHNPQNFAHLQNNQEIIENYNVLENYHDYNFQNLEHLQNNPGIIENYNVLENDNDYNFEYFQHNPENNVENYTTELLENMCPNIVFINPNGIDDASLNCILALINDS